MSWQEELRKLDEELAAGRLSADDYRVRRDQVLSSAVTHGDDADPAAQGQAQQPQGQPPAQQSPQQPPADQPQGQQPPQAGQPQQPQQQPGQQPQPPQNPNQGGDAGTTQVIAAVPPPSGQQGTPQQTGQPDPQSGDPERTQTVQPADPDATQAVQPLAGQPHPQQPHPQQPQQQPPYQQPQASPAGGFQQPQQPWNAPEADQSPPWGGEFPPVSPGNSAEWGQGPEDAFESESSGGKGRVVAIVAAVVLLLGIATGAFFLFGSDDQKQADDKQQGQQQGQQQGGAGAGDESSQAPQPDDMPLDGQKGTPGDSQELDSWDNIPDIQLLNPDELKAYQSAAPGEAKYQVYNHGKGNSTIVLMVKVADKDAASAAVGELRDIQVKNNQKTTSVNGVPGSVQVTEVDKKKGQPATARAHYLSGDVLVRIEGVSQNGKLDAIRKPFEDTLKTQLDNLPADE